MLFDDLAAASERLAATPSRRAKTTQLADVLRATDPGDVPAVLPVLSGRLRQRRTGLGYAAAARRVPPPAAVATLTVAEVDAAFDAAAGASGPGSAEARRLVWHELLSRATGREQRLLVGLVTGDVRQGAADGVLVDALASAVEASPAAVRRAVTMAGDVVVVGVAALADGAAALERFTLTPGTPLAPMLAQSAPDVAAALARSGPAIVEWKLDGYRVQAHAATDGTVQLFSRSLDEITHRLPGVSAAVAALGRACVLDGEVLLVGADGRPRPFQETSSRVSRAGGATGAASTGVASYAVFDLLHLDGADLVDRPLSERHAALAALVTAGPPTGRAWPPLVLTPSTTVPGEVAAAAPPGPAGRRAGDAVGDAASEAASEAADAAATIAAEALAAGHEGVVVKSVAAGYAAGRRGAAWVKVKPVETFDLVVLAAEWGSGRRRGWLSNLHLGARDPEGRYGPAGGFVMLGKTFKGLTDAMLAWQTEELLRLRLPETAPGPTPGTAPEPRRDTGWHVRVAAELVVEIAVDGVQTSSRYPAGMALRFARVVRHRPDKRADEADTVDTVRSLHRRG